MCVRAAFEAAVVGEKFKQGNERGNKPVIDKGGKRIVSMKLLKLGWQPVTAILSATFEHPTVIKRMQPHTSPRYCDDPT